MSRPPVLLYDIVEQYAAFGNHHTGTQADRDTTAWLVGLLRSMGATVDQDPFVFDRYAAEAELTVDGQIVPCLPLFYSAIGEFDTTDVEIIEIPRSAVGSAHTIDGLLPASPDTSLLIVAIESPVGLPVQCNRAPTQLLGRPAIVITTDHLQQVRSGARVRFNASMDAGKSANIIASIGDPRVPEVMITTPLTGWTPAAGERGTGLAVALATAVALADSHRVIFSACSGHELDHVGLRHFLAANDLTGRNAIHLGASVAACEPAADGTLKLGARLALTTATGSARRAIGERVADGNWTLFDIEPPWPGEGGTWHEAGSNVLSFLGSSSLFHTIDDVAEKATTPEALDLATTVALDAVKLFLDRA